MERIFIYKITNSLTGSVYIGKTNNIERRMREHKSHAFNKHGEEYNKLLSKKLRQYGIKNFTVEVIEETTSEAWEEREVYWISYYNSFKGTGYNEDYGGGGVPVGSQLSPHIDLIIADLKRKDKTQGQIAKEYNVSESVISNINTGLLLKQDGLSYPIRKNGINDSVLFELKDLLENTTISMREISERLGIAESTVKKINHGKISHPDIFTEIPVRKISGVKAKANIVKQLLIETDYTFKEIVSLSDTSMRTVGRINNGETHFDPELSYPLRK